MKKLFSLALALVMMLALAANAMAADITVSNPDDDETYKAYKIFNYTNSGSNYAYFIDTDDMVCSNLNALIENYKQGDVDVFTLVPSKSDSTHLIVNVNEGVSVDPVALAAYLSQYVGTMTATKTADATGKFADLSLGYYFVDTSLGSLCSLVNTDQSQVLYEKNPAPTVVKKVQEDSNDSWGSYNHDDIGETVEFMSTITIPANTNNSSSLSGVENLVLHDAMNAVLDWNENSVAITVDGSDLAASNYTVTAGADGCTFEVAFTKAYLDTLSSAAHTIVVTYDAVLTTAAEADTAYENSAWVTFGANSESATSTTYTYTYDFDLIKYTMGEDAETQLAGAEFTLSYNEDGSNPIAFVEVNGGYRIATDADEDTTTTLVAGNVNILGLDADTYYLTETKAPDGYNLLDKAIKVDVLEANDGAQHTIEVDDVAVPEDVVKVLNLTGSILPSTGGVGTTIFYTVGGVMMAAAFVLFITKKKMASEQ